VNFAYAPTHIKYDSVNSKVYTSSGTSGTIDVWNDPVITGSFTKLSTITFSASDFNVSKILLNSTRSRLYVITYYNIYVINTTNNSLLGSISLSNNFGSMGPFGASAPVFLDDQSTSYDKLYVYQFPGNLQYNYGQLHIIDTVSLTITNSIIMNTGYANDVVFDHNKNIAYLSFRNSSVNSNTNNFVAVDVTASIANSNNAVILRNIDLGLSSRTMIFNTSRTKLIFSGDEYPAFGTYNLYLRVFNAI
jgi:hypothetical protein